MKHTHRASLILILAALTGCTNNSPPSTHPASTEPLSVIDPKAAAASTMRTTHPIRFVDATAAAKISWTFTNGATARHLFVESMGGGCAFLDYNNDGLIDIFAVQGGPVPSATGAEANFSRHDALYRNNGDGTFSDVTAGAGLDVDTGYGQGVSTADFDNDGFEDIYIGSYGGNHLFHNNGNGTFTDVTAKAGVADKSSDAGTTEPPWPTSSAWADYDNDGRLDLFVCHYCRWSKETSKPCVGALGYNCRPQMYPASVCRLYHNDGNGVFTDVTRKSGIDKATGKSLGAAWVDYDADGYMDLFVTNDTVANVLFHNNHNGTFTDKAGVAGVALNDQGLASAGMGIGVGDYDNDGRADLFVANYTREFKSAFHNLGHGLFENMSYQTGLAATNAEFLGFGLDCLDYDLDGHPDLVVGNGHIKEQSESGAKVDALTSYAQSQQLLHNQGDGTFVDDQRSLGDLVLPRVTRGLSVGDYDNDGDPDVLMLSQTGPLQLYRNDGGSTNHWITFRLEGVKSNRDAVGAEVTVTTAHGKQTQWVNGGSSYCSQSDRRLTFGLAGDDAIGSLQVRWPSGVTQHVGKLPSNRFYLLKEGAAPVPEIRHPIK